MFDRIKDKCRMFKIILDFLWEWIVGKDVRFDTAVRHHKKRIVFFVVCCLSLLLNYVLYNRIGVYHTAYEKMKTENAVLKDRSELAEQKIEFLSDELASERSSKLILIKKLEHLNIK